MRLRAQSKSSAEQNWLATCETADWAVCATFQTRFMVQMHANKRMGASMNRLLVVVVLVLVLVLDPIT